MSLSTYYDSWLTCLFLSKCSCQSSMQQLQECDIASAVNRGQIYHVYCSVPDRTTCMGREMMLGMLVYQVLVPRTWLSWPVLVRWRYRSQNWYHNPWFEYYCIALCMRSAWYLMLHGHHRSVTYVLPCLWSETTRVLKASSLIATSLVPMVTYFDCHNLYFLSRFFLFYNGNIQVYLLINWF